MSAPGRLSRSPPSGGGDRRFPASGPGLGEFARNICAALAYYFLAGYLAISILFLAVGAVSDSMRDAQA